MYMYLINWKLLPSNKSAVMKFTVTSICLGKLYIITDYCKINCLTVDEFIGA